MTATAVAAYLRDDRGVTPPAGAAARRAAATAARRMLRRSRLAVVLLAALILALGRGSDGTPEHDQGRPLSEIDTPAAKPASHAEGTGLGAPNDELASAAAGADAQAPPDEAAPMEDPSPEESSTGEASQQAQQDAQQDALPSDLEAKSAQRAAMALLQEAMQEHGVSLSSELLEVGRSLRTTRPVKAAAVLGLLAALMGSAAEGSGGAGAVESGIATAAAVELGQMRLLGEGVERSEAGAIDLFEQAAWLGVGFGVRVRVRVRVRG